MDGVRTERGGYMRLEDFCNSAARGNLFHYTSSLVLMEDELLGHECGWRVANYVLEKALEDWDALMDLFYAEWCRNHEKALVFGENNEKLDQTRSFLLKNVLTNLEIRSITQVHSGICVEFKHTDSLIEAWVEVTIPCTLEEANGCYEFFDKGINDNWCIIEEDKRLGGGHRLINISSGGHYWTARPRTAEIAV